MHKLRNTIIALLAQVAALLNRRDARRVRNNDIVTLRAARHAVREIIVMSERRCRGCKLDGICRPRDCDHSDLRHAVLETRP